MFVVKHLDDISDLVARIGGQAKVAKREKAPRAQHQGVANTEEDCGGTSHRKTERRNPMKIIALIIAAVATLASPALAAEKITIREAMALATALRNLDGHMVIAKDSGGIIMQPWDFGSGSLRLRIANNLTILSNAEHAAESSRNQIVREILKRAGGTEIKKGTADFDEFTREVEEVLDQPAPGTQDLARIKASELKLDKNEIPGTVISSLKPICDYDQ